MAPEPIRRRFADLPHGQVHYREAGAGKGAPVLLLHSSPGSSLQLERLITTLSQDHHVIAPDTPGNGDSTAVAVRAIADLSAVLLTFLDIVDLPPAHVYGMHTGAAIATELALLAPHRIRSMALEGVTRLDPAAQAEFLDRYAPDFTPDLDGAYLARAFQFCRDQFLFFPWFDRTAAAQRSGGLPPAADLGGLVLEVLKAGGSYAANYRAAFRWYAAPRLAKVTCPLLVMASLTDPLHDMTCAVAGTAHQFLSLPPFATPDYTAARRAALASLFARAG